MKDFFENPELLIGLPILLVGLIGILIPVAAAMIPEPKLEGAELPTRHGHPADSEYFKIFIALAVITLIEVALFYLDFDRALLIPALVGFSAVKFYLVVAWFMHLRFDSPLFTTAFVTGLFLAFSVFTVVLSTLGSNIT